MTLIDIAVRAALVVVSFFFMGVLAKIVWTVVMFGWDVF